MQRVHRESGLDYLIFDIAYQNFLPFVYFMCTFHHHDWGEFWFKFIVCFFTFEGWSVSSNFSISRSTPLYLNFFFQTDYFSNRFTKWKHLKIRQAQLRAEADRRGFLSSTDVWIWDNQPHGDSIQSYSPFINWWSRKTFDISGSTKSNTRIFCQLLSFIIRLTKIFYTVLIKPWLINYYISQLTF